MTCPSGIKTLYVNMIFYQHTASIQSVPAMWRDEIQAEIDALEEAQNAAIQERLDALEEAHNKLEAEASNEEEEEATAEPSDPAKE